MRPLPGILARILPAALGALLCSCSGRIPSAVSPGNDYAAYFEILSSPTKGIVSISPYTGQRDTLLVGEEGLSSLVCMSSSYIGCLEAIGGEDRITGVSGIGYISSKSIVDRYEKTRRGEAALPLYDIGYDAAPDYERILSLHPDVVLAYSVGDIVPTFIGRLRSLGIRVFMLYDHLEDHPLARSEYVRALGTMIGEGEKADSAFAEVRDRYLSIASAVKERQTPRPGVLLNIPYADQWYIPGEESYMSRLIEDAGGEVVGASKGKTESRVVSLEEAYILSARSSYWLDTGWCRTREELLSVNPLFERFRIPYIFNNIRRTTPQGGNDFWEGGAFRCDLVLEDLSRILSGGRVDDGLLHYYIEVL